MTIEFHCPHCDKLLRTPDDKAGLQANCPGCGQGVTIPDPVSEAAQVDSSFSEVAAHSDASQPGVGTGHAAAGAAGEPARARTHLALSGSQYGLKPCPMCGAAIEQSATGCRFCGETVVRQPRIGNWEPTKIDAGEVLNASWETFKDQFGILIGAFLITFVITIALAVIQQVIQGVIAVAFIGKGGGGGGAALAAGFAIIGMSLVFGIISVIIQLYFEAGFTLLLLRVARGESAEISDMFRGGRYLWRILGLVLLVFVLSFGGYLIAFVPAVVMRNPVWIAAGLIPMFMFAAFLALRYWPVVFVIVDRDSGIIQALQDSFRATANNSVAVIVLAFAGFGIYLLGLLACVIGVLAAFPLIRLCFAVAYCGMTGQLALRRD